MDEIRNFRELIIAKWKNLKTLNLCIIIYYLDANQVGYYGCKYLSKGKWNNLTYLNLSTLNDYAGDNCIGD